MKRTRVERGIYRQQNGTYGVYLLVDGKPRYKTVGTKLAEARRQRDLLSAKAQRGELPELTRLTFAQLAETWIANFETLVAAGERAERTLENYRYHLDKHLLPAFGRKRLPEVTTDDIATMIASLRGQGLAPKTINGSLVPLGRILAHALRRGYITDNPLRRLEQHERPRVQKRDQRVLDHDEIARLLDASLPPLPPAPHHGGLHRHAPLRASRADLVRPRSRERIDPRPLPALARATTQSRATRPAQNQRRRTRHSTSPPAQRAPQTPQLASRHSADSDYVFTTVDGGPLYCGNVEKRGLRRAADHAGLNKPERPRLRLHDLRHTFASHLVIDLKLDIAHVSRILGHARPSITLDTYTHLFNQASHAADIRERMAASDFGALIAGAAAKPST